MQTVVVIADPDVCTLVTRVLQQNGHTVATFGDAATAWVALQHALPDLLVLEWANPGIDGLMLCQRVRALPKGALLEIMMLISHEQSTALTAALAVGANDVVALPCAPAELTLRVSHAESHHYMTAALREAHHEAGELAAERTLLLDQMPYGVIMLDEQGRVVLLNAAARRIAGPEQVPARPVAELVGEFELREPATLRPLAPEETPVGKAMAGESVPRYEYVFRRPGDDRDRWIAGSAVPRFSVDQSATGAVIVFADVTEEREMARRLSTAEERLRMLDQALPVGVIVLDAAMRILEANAAAQALLGESLETLRELPVTDPRWTLTRLDGASLPVDQHPALRALRTGQPQRQVLGRLALSHGTRRTVLIDAVPVVDQGAMASRVVVCYTDVTDHL